MRDEYGTIKGIRHVYSFYGDKKFKWGKVYGYGLCLINVLTKDLGDEEGDYYKIRFKEFISLGI